MGLDLRWSAKFSELRAALEQALRSGEAALGPDHPDVATTLSDLGSVLHALGDLDMARAHLERALRIRERALGPDHPDVATTLSNLGSVLRALGDLDMARAHLERALRIGE